MDHLDRFFVDQFIAPIKGRNAEAVLFPDRLNFLNFLWLNLPFSLTVIFKALFETENNRLGKAPVKNIRRRKSDIKTQIKRRGNAS